VTFEMYCKKTMALFLMFLVLVFLLISCEKECEYCGGIGTEECSAKIYAEMLSGKPSIDHDCGLCENGVVECEFCDGTGVGN